jgi:lipoprotein NlpD
VRAAVGLACFCLLTACASRPPAPIEERSSRAASGPVAPGHYRVHQGDTLYAIAFSQGLDYRVLARWNGLRPPYVIYPGQDLRLIPPASGSAGTSGATGNPPKTAESSVRPPPAQRSASRSAKPPAAPPKSKPAPQPARSSASPAWTWPVKGTIKRGFVPSDPARNGLDITGREGEPVQASAAGSVVYSGNGLIGYGELIIVKHDDQWLSAYAHNRRRLVAEGDSVKAGQRIAELGRNDRNEQILHFEIRRDGKPVNPLDYLPAR